MIRHTMPCYSCNKTSLSSALHLPVACRTPPRMLAKSCYLDGMVHFCGQLNVMLLHALKVVSSFQEALRLYPAAPASDRVASRDMQVGGYFIPKGTVFWLSLYAMQTLGSVHDDPTAFKPVSAAKLTLEALSTKLVKIHCHRHKVAVGLHINTSSYNQTPQTPHAQLYSCCCVD